METRLAVHQDHGSRLESMPVEIRRQILSVSDLSCLKALIHASPVLHRQYLLDRKSLLAGGIESTLGSVSIDAYAIQKSVHEASDSVSHFTGLLETWRTNIKQRSSQYLKLAGDATEDEITSLVSIYFRKIVPVTKLFAEQALDELANQTMTRKDPELSMIEWQRCVSATYRFQLLCRVAGPPTSEVASDNARFLFQSLEPWEVEELYAFYQFAEGVYDKIFDRIRVDLHPENPRFADQDRPPTPDGAFELDNSWARRNLREGTILRGGLDLLSTVLFDIRHDDRERLVTIMQQSIVSSYIPISDVEGVLGETQQTQRREQEPSLGDHMTEERVPMPFRGDGLDAPPLAWTLIWGGTYSNLYGWYTSDEMRRWAYVFWDGARLRSHGGEELLARQWEDCWDEDPREMLY